MSAVDCVILVPATAEARERLMSRWQGAPCPPASVVLADDGWGPGWGALCGLGVVECALPLWWEGVLVAEGYDRARRVFGWHDWPADPTQHGGAAYLLRTIDAYGPLEDMRIVALRLVDGELVEVACREGGG